MPWGFSLPEDFYWRLPSSGSGCDCRIDDRLYEEEKSNSRDHHNESEEQGTWVQENRNLHGPA